MAFVERYAKDKGYRKVFLYTGKDMARTRGFYERLGYSLINEFPGYYGYPTGDTTAVLYGKGL
jgi:ribosomal protein S18 acetylase RimI-like enzyme